MFCIKNILQLCSYFAVTPKLFTGKKLKGIEMKALKKTMITKPTTANAVVQQLDKLHTQREQFEVNIQARSNEKLYEICGLIYAQYCAVKDDKKLLKEIVVSMKKHFEERGQRIQSNSSILGLFVRYVFNGKRQAMHIYTRALQYLLAEDVKPENAATFIAKKGGIDECFKARTPSQKQLTKQEKIKQSMVLVEEMLNSKTLKPIAKIKVQPLFVAEAHKSELTFMMGRSDAQGNVDVFSVVPTTSKGMVTMAKKSLALFLGNHQEQAISKQKANRKTNAISKAVVAAKKKKVDAGTATMEEALN